MRSAMHAASQLPGRSPLMWMMPLHLHVNQKSDYDMMMKNICFGCVREISPRDVSFTHPKHMFDRETNDDNDFGGNILLGLPPYNSNY